MKAALWSFAKHNWVGILIGIVCITLSIYFYKKSIAKPEPVFLIDPVRTKIIESKHILETPLRLVRPNGNEIKGNVTSVRFYFWNNGREPIKKSNILEPLVITLDDPNGEILDYTILKCSRKVVKPVVGLNSIDPNKNLLLSFAILEQKDGLTGQVIYKDEPEAKFVIYGTIVGVQKILTDTSIIQKGWPKEFIKEVGIFILFMGLLGFWIYAENMPRKKPTKPEPTKPKPTNWSEMSLGAKIFVIGFFTVVIIGMLWVAKERIEDAKRKTLTSAIQKVPKDIIP